MDDRRPRPMPAHGTHARYQRGCRCEPCREANRVNSRAFRRRQAAGTVHRRGGHEPFVDRLTISLTADVDEALREAADRHYITRSEVARQALALGLAEMSADA